MNSNNFDLLGFLWGTFILVVVPTAVITLSLFKKGTSSKTGTKLSFGKLALSTLLGFSMAILWLSWSPTSSVENSLRYGPPADYPQWQIICCGASLIVGAGLISAATSRNVRESLLVALFVSAGFSTAFALGASFGDPSQEGVGVVFSFVGIFLLCIPLNLTALTTKRIRQKRSNR